MNGTIAPTGLDVTAATHSEKAVSRSSSGGRSGTGAKAKYRATAQPPRNAAANAKSLVVFNQGANRIGGFWQSTNLCLHERRDIVRVLLQHLLREEDARGSPLTAAVDPYVGLKACIQRRLQRISLFPFTQDTAEGDQHIPTALADLRVVKPIRLALFSISDDATQCVLTPMRWCFFCFTAIPGVVVAARKALAGTDGKGGGRIRRSRGAPSASLDEGDTGISEDVRRPRRPKN